jgi:hypothetical protein
MNTIEKLDWLGDIQAHQTLLNSDYETKRKEIMQTIQAEIDALDAEFDPMKANLSEQYAKLEAEIKADVLAGGSTVKGKYMQAVYTKGRVSWDSKILDGLMIAIPQLAQARKEGDPSISLRRVDQK